VTREVVKSGAQPRLEKTIVSSDTDNKAAPSAAEQLRHTALMPAAIRGAEGVSANGPKPGISNTRDWSDIQLKSRLEEIKREQLDWNNTTGSARSWWTKLEQDKQKRLDTVVRLAEELMVRKSTITEFFLAYVYSNTDDIMANLHYLDYTRIKKAEEEKKRRNNKDPLEDL
jgi:hypothetical protein